jgi:hypothetical protein
MTLFKVKPVPVVGFTGTSNGCTDAQLIALRKLVKRLAPDTAHHGDCVGADEQFHGLLEEFDISPIIHPPVNPVKRAFCKAGITSGIILPAREYLVRNKDIVKAADKLIACPHTMEEQLRSGTWSTYRYAKKLQLPIYVIYPDGKVTFDPGVKI